MLGTIVIVGFYVALCSLSNDKRFELVRSLAIRCCVWHSTSFRNVNLTDANFTKATVKCIDLRGATLIRTYWLNARGLDYACVTDGYLQYPEIRKLVTTLKGQRQKFDHLNLEGINLKGANLQYASFIGTNLNNANLQDADLSRATLVQSQLDGTDFTGATLTGAYIEDWGITSKTKLNGVRCEYVYMRLPTIENPEPLRKPDNNEEVFADGEFGDFIQPIFDTLDLYHSQGVDPRAIAISFKQLAENHPEADLRIVGMEVRGEDKFLLRAKTASAADKSELSSEYFATYNQFKELSGQELRALIAAENIYTRKLENMFKTALERPSVNVQGDNNKVVQGDTNMTGDRNINTDGGNYNERIQGDYVQGNYYAAGQPQSLAQAAAEIQLLLKQLEQTYPTTSTSQQMVVAAEAVNRIESNPLLKERVINAAKEGGLAAFEKAIDNPAGAFIVNAIKGWQEVKNV
ncbi:MAG: pentapeptide repeat-containing protein [Nostoc sp.]